MAVELLPFRHAFINSLDSMVRLLDEVGLEGVTAAIDISHLWLQRIEPSEIARLRGRIGQVHIADCDGVHHGDLPAAPSGPLFARPCECSARKYQEQFPESKHPAHARL